MLLQIGISDARGAIFSECVVDAGDDVAAAFGGVEDAAAVGEAAIHRRQILKLKRGEIEDADRGDGFGDFLSVGPDVLDRSAAHGAGDSGKTLDAGVILLDGMGDEGIPVFSGSDAEGIGSPLDALEHDVQDESGKARVGDKEIAASTEREKRQGARASEVDGFEDFVFGRGLGEPARRASDFEGGVGGERDVFAELQTHRVRMLDFKFLATSRPPYRMRTIVTVWDLIRNAMETRRSNPTTRTPRETSYHGVPRSGNRFSVRQKSRMRSK